MSDDDQLKLKVEVLIEEYKILWEYYGRTLDERHRYLEYIFKSVSIPLSIIAAALVVIKISGENLLVFTLTIKFVFIILLINTFMIGFTMLTTYTLETKNSHHYNMACDNIRIELLRIFPELKDALTIHKIRSINKAKRQSISTWRGVVPMIINSSTICLLFHILFDKIPLYNVLGVFVSSLLAQQTWRYIIYQRY